MFKRQVLILVGDEGITNTISGSSYAIESGGSLTLQGTLGDITAYRDLGYGASIHANGDVKVDGTIGKIQGSYGIFSGGNIVINGKIGDIIATGNGIDSYGAIEINGIVGDISGYNGNGIKVGHNSGSPRLNIRGTVGTITGESRAISSDSPNGTITISGTVKEITSSYQGIWLEQGSELIIDGTSVKITASDYGIVKNLDAKVTPINGGGLLETGFNGLYGTFVYGNYTLTEDLTIKEGETYDFINGATLVPGAYTLTNNGTLQTNGTAHVHNEDGGTTYDGINESSHTKNTVCLNCPISYKGSTSAAHDYSKGNTCECGTKKTKQTITAAGVEAVYGDSGKQITATGSKSPWR